MDRTLTEYTDSIPATNWEGINQTRFNVNFESDNKVVICILAALYRLVVKKGCAYH